MKSTNLVILAAIIAIAGTWSKKKQIDQRQVVGATALVLMFVFITNSQPKFASSFAWLILVTTVGAYGEDLFGVVGTITGGTTTAGKAAGLTAAQAATRVSQAAKPV